MADVSTHATLPTNLVSYWEMEETSGTRVDSKGTADLTDNNTVGYATGKHGNGADFELSSSEYLSATDSSLDVQGDFSISLWASMEDNTPSAYARIWTLYSGSNVGRVNIAVEPTSGKLTVIYYNSSAQRTYWRSDNALFSDINTLHHIAITVDVSDVSSGVKAYFDNNLLTGSYLNTYATNLGSNSGVLAIGAYVGGSDYWDGILDEYGFWSKILTASEVSDLYNAGDGIPYSGGGGGGGSVKPQFVGFAGL